MRVAGTRTGLFSPYGVRIRTLPSTCTRTRDPSVGMQHRPAFVHRPLTLSSWADHPQTSHPERIIHKSITLSSWADRPQTIHYVILSGVGSFACQWSHEVEGPMHLQLHGRGAPGGAFKPAAWGPRFFARRELL